MSGQGVKIRPWHREAYVWLLLSIPLCAVGMGAVVVFLAVTGEDGPLADAYFRPGLEEGREQERDRRAHVLSLSATLRLDRDAGQVQVTIHAPLDHDMPRQLAFRSFHATQASADAHTVLTRTKDWHYVGPLRLMIPGKWTHELASPRWRLLGLARVPGAGVVRMAPRPPG